MTISAPLGRVGPWELHRWSLFGQKMHSCEFGRILSENEKIDFFVGTPLESGFSLRIYRGKWPDFGILAGKVEKWILLKIAQELDNGMKPILCKYGVNPRPEQEVMAI